jgi:hypothetical protein
MRGDYFDFVLLFRGFDEIVIMIAVVDFGYR